MSIKFDGEINVPEKAILIIDDNVLAKLPLGTTGESITAHGATNWVRTALLRTRLADGSAKSFFLKVSFGQRGREMMSRDWLSMAAIFTAIPDFSPVPIARGIYSSDPNTHFFLYEMLIDELPDVQPFYASVAALHRISKSPTGKYRFPVYAYQGNT